LDNWFRVSRAFGDDFASIQLIVEHKFCRPATRTVPARARLAPRPPKRPPGSNAVAPALLFLLAAKNPKPLHAAEDERTTCDVRRAFPAPIFSKLRSGGSRGRDGADGATGRLMLLLGLSGRVTARCLAFPLQAA
jgi:hypothetical protein